MRDDELLREYVQRQSEAAFSMLVERHASLIYSAALRRVGDPELAAEVTQAVFVVLARKAHALGRQRSLTGWLYRATRFAASEAVRTEQRRKRREQETELMETTPTADSSWEEVAPLLDGAMDELGDKDREAVLLRYFEKKSFAEVGAALGASEDSARMRVGRALEKMRVFFARRGTIIPAATVGGLLTANAVQAAPSALTASLATTATVKGMCGTASTVALVKATLNIMTWMKAKAAAWTGAGVVLAAGVAVVAVNEVRDYSAFAVADPAKPVRDFLERPPSIKRIEFAVDGRLFHFVIEPGQPEPVFTSPKGMVRFVAGKQGESHYIRQVADQAVQGTVFEKASISGRSKESFWVINRSGVVLTSRDDPRAEAACRDASLRLWGILTFQIPWMKYGSLRWTNSSNFTATTIKDQEMLGKIASYYTNGLPRRIECHIDGDAPGKLYAVELAYREDGMPQGIPCRFSVSGVDGGGAWTSPYHWQIDSLELGEEKSAENGYVPAQFLQFARSIPSAPVQYKKSTRVTLDALADRLVQHDYRGALVLISSNALYIGLGGFGLMAVMYFLRKLGKRANRNAVRPLDLRPE